MASKNVTHLIRSWMEEFGAENGYELSRSEFVKEGPAWFLRVYVDKINDGEYESMDTDDCEKISRFLSDRLDETDPIQQNYYLEVSSPGLDRPLISERDFQRFQGEMIDVNLYRAYEGKKRYRGTLQYKDDKMLTVALEEGGTVDLPAELISKVCLAVIF